MTHTYTISTKKHFLISHSSSRLWSLNYPTFLMSIFWIWIINDIFCISYLKLFVVKSFVLSKTLHSDHILQNILKVRFTLYLVCWKHINFDCISQSIVKLIGAAINIFSQQILKMVRWMVDIRRDSNQQIVAFSLYCFEMVSQRIDFLFSRIPHTTHCVHLLFYEC